MPEPARTRESAGQLGIADVLRYYGATSVPEGVGWKSMNCPFHGDKHASGRVSVDRNAFKCHGCNMSGDAIKLIMLRENKSYGDAIEFAREVFGQSVKGVSRAVPKQPERRPLGRERWKSILD